MKNYFLFIILIYLFIPILILLYESLFIYKFYILVIVGIFLYVFSKFFHISKEELGITKNHLFRSIQRNSIFIILIFIGIILLKIFHFQRYNPTETILFYLFYIFISCPVQEFLFRGIFGYFEKNYKHPFLWVFVSSFLYSFMHIIYRDFITCLLTFIIGIIWYLLYRKDYNLVGVSISHIVLGIFTILFGIIN